MIWFAANTTIYRTLQRVQNTAAHLICDVSCFDHISPVLFKLRWLPRQFRIKFKVLVITFKDIHGLAPESINDLISIKGTSHYSFRSNSEVLLGVARWWSG